MADAPGQTRARVGLAFLGLMFAAPFLVPVHHFPLTNYYPEWLALALGLAAMSFLASRRAWDGLRVPVLALFPLGLALLVGVQAALGLVPYSGQALLAGCYLVWAALLVVLAAALEREIRMEILIRTLAWFLAGGGLLSAAAAVLQHYGATALVGTLVLPKTAMYGNIGRVYGNIGQYNLFADYVALALVSAAYLYATRCVHWVGAALLAAPMLFVLGLSASRTAWSYLIFACALAGLFWVLRRDDLAARRLALVAGVSVVGLYVLPQAALISWLAPAQGEVTTAAERMFASASGVTDRLQLWSEAWWMFQQAPVLGNGWGSFPWRHFEYQGQFAVAAASGPYHQAHNIVMHLAAETGIGGLALVFGAVALWVIGLRRGTWSPERWWQAAILGILALHSLHEFPLWYASFLGIGALVAGIGAHPTLEPRSPRLGRLIAACVLVLGAIGLPVHGLLYRDLERLFGDERRSLAEAEQHRVLGRALLDPILRPYAELTVAFSVTVESERLAEKIRLVERAARFSPYYVVVYKQAALLALAGERDAAVRWFDMARRAFPAELADARSELEVLAVAYPGKFDSLLKQASVPGR